MGEVIILDLMKIISELFIWNSQQNDMKLMYFLYYFKVISSQKILYNTI